MPDFSQQIKKQIVQIGQWLWDKGLVSGLNGNISRRVSYDIVALTATKVCLGKLTENDVLLLKTNGEMIDEGQVSTEKSLHLDVYNSFPEINAVIHTHTPHVNGYFLDNEIFEPRIIESRLFLGQIQGIAQTTPSVLDTAPVIKALKSNNLVVLRHHGVLAIGANLKDAFWLIQGLEDAIKTEFISRLFNSAPGSRQESQGNQKDQGSRIEDQGENPSNLEPRSSTKKYELFSQEQIDEIVRLVNEDDQLKILGQQTQMTFDLAVKMDETGQVYRFNFDQGRILDVTQDEKAEFLITAPAAVWRAVFNQEIDPFVATTQKKMILHGDFGKISKWYAPCSRVFELWQQVPVD